MRAAHLLEYVLARAGLGLVDRLPVSFADGAARRAADLYYALGRARRRIAVENILAGGVTASRAEAAAIARRSFRHFAMVVVESLKSAALLEAVARGEAAVEWDAPPELLRLLDDPRQGIILASGHLGNWEVAAQLLSLRKPVLGVTRAMNNPYIERLIQTRKPRHRFRLTPKHAADTGRFLAALKNGELLALMIDQHARDRGMPIEFFGRPASTHTAIALLHLVTGAPLCFGYCRRLAPMRFAFHAVGPIRRRPTGDKQADVRWILETLMRELEQAVRAWPDQYLWAHRRWRPKS